MQASEEYMPFMNLMKEKTAMSKVLFIFPLFKINLGLRKILLKFKIHVIAILFLSFRLSLSSCRAIQRQDMRIC